MSISTQQEPRARVDADQAPTPDCALCHQPITDRLNGPHVLRRVTGYTGYRKRGINSIRMWSETGDYAHTHCVDKEARRGISASQGELL